MISNNFLTCASISCSPSFTIRIGAGCKFFLRHDGIYPLLRLLCRDMIALHDALDADRYGSRYADHEIEVDTAVETAIEEDGTLHPLIAALLKSRATAG